MKPLIVGEGPSRSGDRYHHFPLSGQVGKRLCTWAGIEPFDRDRSMASEYARWYWALSEQFDLMNFYERYPQDWTPDVALARFREVLEEEQLRERVVVLLGVRVQTVFRLAGFVRGGGFCEWEHQKIYKSWVVTIPHPSGLNRLYNEEQVVQASGLVLQRAMVLRRQLSSG